MANVATPNLPVAAVGDAVRARLIRRRYLADVRLRIYGIVAIAFAAGLLGLLLITIFNSGRTAFFSTKVELTIEVPAGFDANAFGAEDNLLPAVYAALRPYFPPTATASNLRALLTPNAKFMIRDAVRADPSVIGGTLTILVPAADHYDLLEKGILARDHPNTNATVLAGLDAMKAANLISQPFKWELFTGNDSRYPEVAGIRGAITGTALSLLVCFILAFPIGIAAAIYLEEFSRKGRMTDLIEVNINNLAAVPSIVFGLLGLAVLLGWFGLTRGTPVVAGMVLALMTLPTLIIVTRAALKAVPPSIREAAYGVGASKHQVVLHHVLPLALPGILTGTIIGLAQAAGETAPLILLGLNAFTTSPPGGLFDPATTLPTQILIYSDYPGRGFVALTSAVIIVLLGFLIIMNALAIFLRQRLERTW